MSTVRRGDIVRGVLDALEGRGDAAATEGNAGLEAGVSSDRMPELASRLRRDLQAEGVVISVMGKASSGRHTVVTLRLPSGAMSALEQVDARLQVSISFV